MNKLFFPTRSEMTQFAKDSTLEMIRCKQSCNHVPGAYRPAILLVNEHETIVARLVRCKVCKTERSPE